MWFLLGAAAGAAALWIYQQRQAIAFAAAHKDQIATAADAVGSAQSLWGDVEKLFWK